MNQLAVSHLAFQRAPADVYAAFRVKVPLHAVSGVSHESDDAGDRSVMIAALHEMHLAMCEMHAALAHMRGDDPGESSL